MSFASARRFHGSSTAVRNPAWLATAWLANRGAPPANGISMPLAVHGAGASRGFAGRWGRVSVAARASAKGGEEPGFRRSAAAHVRAVCSPPGRGTKLRSAPVPGPAGGGDGEPRICPGHPRETGQSFWRYLTPRLVVFSGLGYHFGAGRRNPRRQKVKGGNVITITEDRGGLCSGRHPHPGPRTASSPWTTLSTRRTPWSSTPRHHAARQVATRHPLRSDATGESSRVALAIIDIPVSCCALTDTERSITSFSRRDVFFRRSATEFAGGSHS